MKEIQLTRGAVAIVDDEDCEWLSAYKWYLSGDYALRSQKINGKYTSVRMHRQIMGIDGLIDTVQIDHINGNGLDNRRCNLRLCTAQGNARNKRPNKKASSIYKGVYWHVRMQKWQSHLTCDGKIIHIGYFKSEIEAALAYNKKAKALFGEFYRGNKIDGVTELELDTQPPQQAKESRNQPLSKYQAMSLF